MVFDIIQMILMYVVLNVNSDIIKYIYSCFNNDNVWHKLKDKWILVTNATTVIGVAFCNHLAARGCKLILTGTNNEALQKLKDSLEPRVKVACFALDYSTQTDFSFVEKYDIGLVINKIGFFNPDPACFVDKDIDHFIDYNLRGPLFLIKSVLTGMIDKNLGYIINVGFRYTEKPRAYYSLITAVKAMFKVWSESMYYELKGSKINIEYMDTGNIVLNNESPSWLSPDPDTFVNSVLTTFGNSYFTVPYLPHFFEYLFIRFLPKFVVGRYRKAKIKQFSEKINNLY